MSTIESLTKMALALNRWETRKDEASTSELTEILSSIAEEVELATEEFIRLDPDPFDDRHPIYAAPASSLGHLLELIIDQGSFMRYVIDNYLTDSEEVELNTVACRLLIDVLPAQDCFPLLSDLTIEDRVVKRLFEWSEWGPEPLGSYALGVLAVLMESQDLATSTSELSGRLIPKLLDRLHELKNADIAERSEGTSERHFSMFSRDGRPHKRSYEQAEMDSQECTWVTRNSPSPDKAGDRHRPLTSIPSFREAKQARTEANHVGEHSGSSWKELEKYVIGTYPIHPLTRSMQQRLILGYLIPMAEYQEFVGITLEHDAIGLILHYIDDEKTEDIRLSFAALRYLANMLCSKKFAVEFMAMRGVQKLCQVHRPSVAASGVSICFFYISYFDHIMEKVCTFPEHELRNFVCYALWLLEFSHISSCCHTALFFHYSLPFRVVLDIFDQQDGLRKLLNQISTVDILQAELDQTWADGNQFVNRQCVRKVCLALKKYFESHLFHKVEELKRSQARGNGRSLMVESPPYKACNLDPVLVKENVDFLLKQLPLKLHWKPVNAFIELGGMKLLLQLLAVAPPWVRYGGKLETIRCCLDILVVCTTVIKGQLMLLEQVPLASDQHTQGISTIVGLAEGSILSDIDIQKSALNVIINCVCGPMETVGGAVGRYRGGGSRKMVSSRGVNDILQKMWDRVRQNNGIMVLLQVLSTKVPITHADQIRTLACKALVGLSRSDTLKQIMSKLPLFTDDQLKLLMREPVLEEIEHIQFCKYANELLERVTGKVPDPMMDLSLNDVRRADIVAQTVISYPEKELLQLIHNHLVSTGYKESAECLQREANLPEKTSSQPTHPTLPHIYPSGPARISRMSRQLSHPSPITNPSTQNQSNLPVTPVTPHPASTTQYSTPLPSFSTPLTFSTPVTPYYTQVGPLPPVTLQNPIRMNLSSSRSNFSPVATIDRTNTTPSVPVRYSQERDLHRNLEPMADETVPSSDGTWESNITLDRIVKDFLRKQHALCPNPVSIIPTMSIFEPHRCPVSSKKHNVPLNFTARFGRSQTNQRVGCVIGSSRDRKLIYSRFRFMKSYRDSEDETLTCCNFSVNGENLIVGNSAGVVKFCNARTGKELLNAKCHQGVVGRTEISRDGKLLLTSSEWVEPKCCLWAVQRDELTNKLNIPDDTHMEFSKTTLDRLVGTKEETARIYDINTGECIVTMHSGDVSNGYTKNRATFSPDDKLVLNDGALWDVNSGLPIHKFDKFNPNVSGVFHPHGLEIIINSEVWDARKYHLLRTVPALDQFRISFNQTGHVIYGARHHTPDENADPSVQDTLLESTVRVFDAVDYSNTATFDLKRNIQDLCADPLDCLLAVIENPGNDDAGASMEENICRLYQIGQKRDSAEEEDDVDEEEEEQLEEEEEDDSTLDVISVSGDDDDRSGNDSDNADGTDEDDLDDDILFELADN